MPETRKTCIILVVDDDEAVLNIAMAILEESGFETLGATSGPEALEVLAATERRIDALFSDIMMPGMNGFELAQQAKAAWPGLKVILTSGYMAPEMAAAMSLSTAYPTVPKPWRPAQLARTISEVLGVSIS